MADEIGPQDSNTTRTTLERLSVECLAEAKAHGASACEAAASFEEGLSVGVRLGEVETVEYQRDRSVGVTVYFGKRKGSASTADFSPSAVRETVAAACRIARHTAEDPHVGLADPALLATDVPDLDLDHPWALAPEDAIALATRAEDAARSADTRIVNSEGGSCSSHRGLRCYVNSDGFVGHAAGTQHSISCVVIAGRNGAMQRDWWHTVGRASGDLAAPEEVGRKAASRALQRLGARRLKTLHAPVIYAPEVSRSLIGHLLSAIVGSSQYRRSSFLLDALGDQVLPATVTVYEDPLRLRGLASAAFDAEGVATCARDIVRDGVLETYLLDSYAARRLGRQATGHAGGWTNVMVDGQGTRAELASKMGTGLLVTELMGHGVNIVTGDYSRGAAGFWIEGGEIAYPVEEITIAGNLRDMLRGIVAVGADRDEQYAVQVGSIVIDRMAVAGE
ncbi:MAG: metalloprotease PmbA [Xanthomonadaceae bacterium]|nr:metalloprotease PmbA [Xanthomonadaceae bacterium]